MIREAETILEATCDKCKFTEEGRRSKLNQLGWGHYATYYEGNHGYGYHTNIVHLCPKCFESEPGLPSDETYEKAGRHAKQPGLSRL